MNTNSKGSDDNTKIIVMTAITGGGFSFEINKLFSHFEPSVDFVLLKSQWSGDFVCSERVVRSYLLPDFASRDDNVLVTSTKAFLRTFFCAVWALLNNKVDFIVIAGSSHAIPILLANLFFRRKAVFLESITRVPRLSRTGQFVYTLRLCSLFIIQWPKLQSLYPRSKLGTIL